MAVSVRELFLIVRAQDQASRNLRFVGANLRGIASAAELNNAKARAAQRLEQVQLRQASARLRIQDLGNNLSTHQNKLDELGNKNLEARVLAAKELNKINEEAMLKQARAAQLENALSRPGAMRTASGKFASRAAAQAELKQLNSELAQVETRMGMAAEGAIETGQAFSKQSTQVEKAANAHALANNQLKGLNITEAQAIKNVNELNKAQAQMKWRNMGNVGRAMSNLGRSMQFVGGVGVAALGFAANSAAKFSRDTQLAATQASSSLREIATKNVQIQNVVLRQMQKFPATADEMSQSLYDIFSGTNVQKISQGAKLLTIFNKAAVAGQTDLNTATQAGITILNAYSLKVSQMPKLMQEMFSAVRFGRMNFTEFGQSLNQIVPAFKGANQSINVMLGSLAFLTRRMPNVRMASTSLARMVEVLSLPKLSTNLAKVGVNIKDMHGNLLPIPTVLGRIIDKFPQLTKGANIQNWLKQWSGQTGYIQARRALVHIIQSFGQYQTMLKQVGGDQDEFTRSFAALSKTPGNQWAVMLNKLKVLWLNLGRAALPALLNMSKYLMVVVNGFNRLSDATNTNLGQWLVYGAALTVIVGIFVQIIGVFQEALAMAAILATRLGILSVGFDDVAVSAAAAGVSVEEFEAATTFGALGVGASAAAVAITALAGAWLFYKGTQGRSASLFRGQEDAMVKAKGSADGLAKSIGQLSTAYYNFKLQQGTVEQLKKEGASRVEIAHAIQMQADASDHYNKVLEHNTGLAKRVANDAATARAFLGRGLTKPQLGHVSAAQFQSTRFGINDPTAANKASNDELQRAATLLPKVTTEYMKLLDMGADPATKGMTAFRHEIVNMEAEVRHFSPTLRNFAQHLSEALGRPAAPNEINFAQHLNKRIIPAATNFAKITGSLPSRQVVKLFLDHKNASLALSSFVGMMHKMPTRKQIKLLSNIPNQAIPWLQQFIKQFKRIPTRKQIKIEVDKENAAQRQINKTRTQLSNLAKHEHDMKISGRVDPKLTKAVQDAQAKLNHLTGVAKKKREADVNLKFKPNYGAFVGQAQSLGAAAKQGIVTGASGLEAALEAEWIPAIQAAVAATKQKALDAKSPSKVTARELGVPMMQGIIMGIRSQEPALQQAMNHAVTHAATGKGNILGAFLSHVSKSWLKNLHEAGITLFASGKFSGKLDDHAQKIAKQMGVFLTKNHTWSLAGEGIGRLIANGINRGLIKQAGGKAALKTIVDTMASTFSDIKSSVTDSFGQIFGGTAQNQGLQTLMGFGGKAPFSAVKGDLKAQLQRFTQWTNALKKLRKRGIPDSLYQQLLAAGPDSLPAVLGLASASTAQLRQYDRMFSKEQKMIGKQTRAAFGVQMDQWKKMGKNMAFGILTGLKTESPAIISWLRHLAKEMFYTLKKHNKSNSPSKLYYEEGRNMLLGLQMGMQSGTPQFAWGANGGMNGGGHHVHYHYNQTLVRGNQSDATFMRKARFHFESRVPKQ